MLKPRLAASATLLQGGNASTLLVAANAASARLRAPRGALELRRSSGAVTAMLAPFFVGAASASWGDAHLTYSTADRVRIDYDGGQSDTLHFAVGRIDYIDTVDGEHTDRTSFWWDEEGRLTDVQRTELI